MAKLTERQKKNIVSAYAAGGVSYSDLAAKYKVDKATISRIIKEEKNDFATKCNAIKKEAEEKQRQYERQIREYSRGAILCERENSEKKRILEKKARERYEEYHKYCVDNRVAMYPERTKPFADADLY